MGSFAQKLPENGLSYEDCNLTRSNMRFPSKNKRGLQMASKLNNFTFCRL